MEQPKRVAIVTGASRGLGEVIARVLARRGCAVVIGARTPERLQTVAGAIAAEGSTVVAIAGDITDAAARAQLVAAARRLGGLDVLVNNASELGGIGPLMGFEVQRFGRVFPVNAADRRASPATP